jgi:hypothetical protein
MGLEMLELRQIPDVEKWFQSRCDALRMDYSLSPVERLCKYYTILGNPANFRGYEWQIGIINDMHPRQVAVKRSQVGFTLIMMCKVILLLEQYSLVPYYYKSDHGEFMSLHPTAIYTFEDATKVGDFSSDRLKRFIAENSFLQGLLEEGDVDQVRLKRFGNSSLYLGGRRNVQSVTSIPAHIVMADEWDRTYDPNIGEQLESRLKASEMFRAKSQRGLYIKYSTPEAYGAGVDKEYEESDQMVFQIKCSRCNSWQEMGYPDSIAHWYEKGKKSDKKPYYKCLRCHRELDWSEIGCWDRSKPLKIKNAEWVPKRLDYYNAVTRYMEGTRGFRVPWAYSAPVEEVMRDRDKKSKLYFFHHVLGQTYAEDSTGLIPDSFTSRIDSAFEWGRRRENWVYVMGVDQGCYVSVWGMIPFSRDDGNPWGKWVLCHFEHAPNEQAFTTFQIIGKETIPKRGRLHEIMKEWDIDLCVIDAEPSGNEAHNFSREFEARVLVNHSTGMRNHDPSIGFNFIDFDEDEDGNKIFIGRISEDRTSAIDCYFDFVREGSLSIAAGCEESRFKEYIDHHTNIRKVTEEKSGGGLGVAQMISSYKSFGLDHFGHSGKFAFQAAVLIHKLNRATSHIIIPGAIEGWKFGSKNGTKA